MVQWHRVNILWLRCRSSKDTSIYRLLHSRPIIWKTSANFSASTRRARSKPFQHQPLTNEISRRVGRTFIYLFGLALGLVSLGAIHFLHWISLHELKREAKVRPYNHVSVQTMTVGSSTHAKTRASDSCADAFSSTSQQYSSNLHDLPKSQRYTPNHFPQGSFFVELDGINLILPMRSTMKFSGCSYPIDVQNPFDDVSPFMCTNAMLNCLHFHNGFSQVCIVCWMNSPSGWVFGPCLMPYDEDHLSLLIDQLIRSKSVVHCRCSTHSTDTHCTLGLHNLLTPVAVYDHAAQRSVPHSNLKPSARFSDDSDSSPPAGPRDHLLNRTRSAGDGAPSASEFSPIQESYSNSKGVVDHGHLRKTPTYPDLTGPKEPQSSPETSNHTLVDPAVVNKWNVVDGQLPSDGASPAAVQDLNQRSSFSVRESSGLVSHHSFVNLQIRTEGPCSHSVDSSSSNLVDNDGLEYDELEQQFPNLLSPELDSYNNVGNQEESQLALLLDTLISFLGSAHEASQEDSDCFISLGQERLDKKEREKLQKKFAELTQTTTDLSDDLLGLESVIHRLNYRMKAAQIELNQAEDNLHYVWYLRETLEGSSIGSSSQTSCASDMSLLGTDSPSNDFHILHAPTVSQVDHMSSCSSPHCHLEQHIPFTSPNLPSENSVFIDKISDFHIHSEERDALSVCMTSSTPAPTFSQSQFSSHLQNVRWRDLNPTAKRYVKKHRRRTIPSFTLDAPHAVEEDAHTVKSDGFLYPELTFDNDGIIDWVESISMNPEKSLQSATLKDGLDSE